MSETGMSKTPHNKIINKAAREVLKPIGVMRKGQSRTWLDDNDWCITVIEFQPSSWSRGTYLNIGICWQWYPKDYYSFDIGYREAGFIEYKNDEQFEPKALALACSAKALALAEQAKAKVLEIRDCLADSESLKGYVLNSFENKPVTVWDQHYMGMSCLLSGNHDQARKHFDNVLNETHDVEWVHNLKEYTEQVLKLMDSAKELISFLDQNINESRILKKLQPTEFSLADFINSRS